MKDRPVGGRTQAFHRRPSHPDRALGVLGVIKREIGKERDPMAEYVEGRTNRHAPPVDDEASGASSDRTRSRGVREVRWIARKAKGGDNVDKRQC